MYFSSKIERVCEELRPGSASRLLDVDLDCCVSISGQHICEFIACATRLHYTSNVIFLCLHCLVLEAEPSGSDNVIVVKNNV